MSKSRMTPKANLIRKYLLQGKKPTEVAKLTKSTLSYTYLIKSRLDKQPKEQPKPQPKLQPVKVYEAKSILELDEVNSPPHYKVGGVETINFIEAKCLDYHLGNVVKYVTRAGLKPGNDYLKDLRKAQWYLERAIKVKEEQRELIKMLETSTGRK